MNSRIFRHNMQCACATCGDEWFGKGGEASARRHAADTGHQVQIQIMHQETINPVAADGEPHYVKPVVLSASESRLSVQAARERVRLFETPLMAHHVPSQQLNQRVAR